MTTFYMHCQTLFRPQRTSSNIRKKGSVTLKSRSHRTEMRRSQNIQSILLAEAMEQLSNTHFCFHIFQTTHLHSCVLGRSHPSRCSHTQRPHQEKSKPQKEEEVSYIDRHPCEKGTRGSTARWSEKEVPSGKVYVQNLKTNNKTKTERFRGL